MKYFNVILNFLRTGKVEEDETIDPNFLLEEAKYYGLNGMIVIIEKIQQVKKAKEKEENRKSGQIINVMQGMHYEMRDMNEELKELKEMANELKKIGEGTEKLWETSEEALKTSEETLSCLKRFSSKF